MKQFNIQTGDSAYLAHRRVMVCEVLHEFQLVAVCYENEKRKFYTDICALTKSPTCDYSIPITLFRGTRA